MRREWQKNGKGYTVEEEKQRTDNTNTLQYIVQGDPIEHRYKEHSERGSFVDQLVNHVNWFKQAAASNDAKYDHIDLCEKQKVLNECSEAENWLREKKQQQDSLPKHADPVLLSSDIRKKLEAVDRVCRPIMSKPKPKPAVPEKPASPPPSTAPAQDAEPAENGSPNPNAESNGKADEPAVAMETEKPEAAA
ncbi:heat shock 70 kDa protein 15-like [Bidens hawaiensis]|uniref:heat shock 70 kDa protein 15-like n=1 Tax=Bidens hawaiensis TaxID=980011 RepID=UPI004049A3A6